MRDLHQIRHRGMKEKSRITALHPIDNCGVLFFVPNGMRPQWQSDRTGIGRIRYGHTKIFRPAERFTEQIAAMGKRPGWGLHHISSSNIFGNHLAVRAHSYAAAVRETTPNVDQILFATALGANL